MRFRRSHRSSARRKFQWAGSLNSDPVALAIPAVAGTSVAVAAWVRVPAGVFDSINQENVPTDWTLTRQINQMSIGVVAIDAGSYDFTVGMGVLAWDDIDDVAPVAGLDTPLPVQGQQFDWVWWFVQPWQINFQAGTSLCVQNNGITEFAFSRTQRKLSQGTGLLVVAEVFANKSGMNGVWGWSHDTRYGFKLP